MKTKLSIEDQLVREFFEDYKLLQAKKRHLEKKLSRVVYNMQGLTAMDYNKPNVQGGKYNDAPTQLMAVIDLQDKIAHIKSDIEEKEYTIQLVNNVSSEPLSSKILLHSFVDNLNVEQISLRLGMSIWSIYKKRKDSIKHLAFIINEDIRLENGDLLFKQRELLKIE